jgi:hypothetical protein
MSILSIQVLQLNLSYNFIIFSFKKRNTSNHICIHKSMSPYVAVPNLKKKKNKKDSQMSGPQIILTSKHMKPIKITMPRLMLKSVQVVLQVQIRP